MNFSEKIKAADTLLAVTNLTGINYKTIGALRDLLNDINGDFERGNIEIEKENDDLMPFSKFTLSEAKKRLNSFDYRIDNVVGTEFEVENVETGNSYIVDFRAGSKKASCTCPDFLQRKRVCKHIAFVAETESVNA
jgi:hypothetical protein